ncbi:hypothetical protein [Flaviaesturariibacter amylovorans]|uniref:Uncharacterized protein n=1 Tax=Flaviaesturariibacter amylovorans TaxID=1084520 RepID=A0ABP8HPK0_9BACT
MHSLQKAAIGSIALLAIPAASFLLSFNRPPAPPSVPTCVPADTTTPKAIRVLPAAAPKPAPLPFPLNHFRTKDSTGRQLDLYGRPIGC